MHDEALKREVVGDLVATDPRRSAEGTLALLEKRLHGRAALFTVRPGLELFVAGRGITQAAINHVEIAWDERTHDLLAGSAVMAAAHVVVPIGAPTVALLYVEGPVLATERAAHVLHSVAEVLELAVAARETGGETYVERTPLAEFERHKLLAVLERVGWNVAQAARRLGVTRVTVYQRLRRHGIALLRPPRARGPRGPA